MNPFFEFARTYAGCVVLHRYKYINTTCTLSDSKYLILCQNVKPAVNEPKYILLKLVPPTLNWVLFNKGKWLDSWISSYCDYGSERHK